MVAVRRVRVEMNGKQPFTGADGRPCGIAPLAPRLLKADVRCRYPTGVIDDATLVPGSDAVAMIDGSAGSTADRTG